MLLCTGMPLYEYKCEACGNRFEKIVKFSDPPLAACPKCGGKVEKLLSSPAFQFKGSGWYITDYPKKSSPDGSSGKSASDKAASGSSETKSDSAAKSDSSPAPATNSKQND
jgi:putative FmdB family regulatory protein